MKSEDVSALYDACEGGKYHTAVELIESEQLAPNVMFQFLMDNGPLLKFAAGSGNLKLVQYLHEVHHVSIESKGEYAGSHDTALSRACRKGHLEVAIYLMSKGANPNSPISYSSVLAEAIKSKKLVLVQELVSRGAKIDSLAISCALEEGVYDISQFLLQKNTGVDLSVGYALNSFIRPAVLGGCVRTLKMLIDTYKLDLFEIEPNCFRKKPKDYWICHAAAESGNLDMVRFLVDTNHIDIKSMVISEYSGAHAYQQRACDTILGAALKSDSITLIRYLFEQLELVPPQEALKTLKAEQAKFSSIEINAYLESYLVESALEKQLLLQLAGNGLCSLNMTQLLSLYYSRLPKKGMFANFNDAISSYISKQAPTAEEISDLLSQNSREFSIHLLYYFVNNPSALNFTLQINAILKCNPALVNSTNSSGETLLHLAIEVNGYSDTVTLLLQRGANPDTPNLEGRTAINMLGRHMTVRDVTLFKLLTSSSDYTNSLKHAVSDDGDQSLSCILRHSKGAIGSANARDLLTRALKTRVKVFELLHYVSEPIFNEMKSLLTTDFISKYADTPDKLYRDSNPYREFNDSAVRKLLIFSDFFGFEAESVGYVKASRMSL